jgi:hypothetical protein
MSSITAIPGATQIATGAIQRSTKALARDAAVVATPGVASRDLVAALVDSKQQVLYTAAAAKLISASDEMTRSILDAIA